MNPFTTLFDSQTTLKITSIPYDINARLNAYVENRHNDIYTDWYDTYIRRIFHTSPPNMNIGIYDVLFFEDRHALTGDIKYVVDTAHDLLVRAGFRVKNRGYVHIDIFHMDTTVPTKTNYSVSCDNQIGYYHYETCVFYTRKDDHVCGDLEVYLEKPSFCPFLFGKAQHMILPTRPNLVVLRSGNLYYEMQPHHGFGKEHVLSVHFVKDA